MADRMMTHRASGMPALLLMVLASVGEARSSIIQQVAATKDRLSQGERAQISFRLATAADVTLEVLDGDIQPVRTMPLGKLAAGKHTALWDGRPSAGRPAPADAYMWRIEARADDKLHVWEPAYLRSRPAEAVWSFVWDPDRKVIALDIPSAMRGWLRIGLHSGACLRTLVEGELWPRGKVEVPWDGRDQSGLIDLAGRGDWFITAFGYRLPIPCVIMTGSGLPGRAACKPFGLAPPLRAAGALWTRVRESCSLDRLRPVPLLTQTAGLEFTVDAAVPAAFSEYAAAIMERLLCSGARVRWFIDGRAVAEGELATLPASFVLKPEELRSDRGPHLVTANIETATHQVYVATTSIQTKE